MLPVRATPNQEMGNVKKRQTSGRISQKALRVLLLPQWGRLLWGGHRSFQVFWRTEMEVELDPTKKNCTELLPLYLRSVII